MNKAFVNINLNIYWHFFIQSELTWTNNEKLINTFIN